MIDAALPPMQRRRQSREEACRVRASARDMTSGASACLVPRLRLGTEFGGSAASARLGAAEPRRGVPRQSLGTRQFWPRDTAPRCNASPGADRRVPACIGALRPPPRRPASARVSAALPALMSGAEAPPRHRIRRLCRQCTARGGRAAKRRAEAEPRHETMLFLPFAPLRLCASFLFSCFPLRLCASARAFSSPMARVPRHADSVHPGTDHGTVAPSSCCPIRRHERR